MKNQGVDKMLVDLTKILQNDKSEDIKVDDVPLSVFNVVRAALLVKKEGQSVQEQAKNFSLWRELKDMEDFEFSADECKRIPVLVNQIYLPLIWGQIVELFDPAILKR